MTAASLHSTLARCVSVCGALWLASAAGPVGAANLQQTTQQASQQAPQQTAQAVPNVQFREFNSEDFLLAYDAMLGASQLQRAYAIAVQAQKAAPNDAAWRLRLATVAEWTQHLEVAAQQWSALFLAGDHSPQVLDALVRLTSVLEDPGLALQVWTLRAQTTALDATQWEMIAALFDQLVQPAQGSAFFEAQFERLQSPLLLEWAATLADHAGDVPRAIRLYSARARMLPHSTPSVVEAVRRLVQADQTEDALRLMVQVAGQVPPNDAEFWPLMAQLAWHLNDLQVAQDVYGRIAHSPQAQPGDWSRWLQLLRRSQPREAADAAMEAYARWEQLEHLLLAMDVHVAAGDDVALGQLLQSLHGTGLDKAQRSVNFLQMRASYYQRTAQTDLAWADWQAAMTLEPLNADMRISALWFLVDQRRLPALERMLRENLDIAQDRQGFWQVYAAGLQLLGQPRKAVVWYRKLLQTRTDDPLLLLNYADALQSGGRSAMATRVRRHAWLTMRRVYAQRMDPLVLQRSPELLAAARLALENRPGDAAQRLVRRLVEALQTPGNASVDREVATLILGWAINTGDTEGARQWMWQRFAQQSTQQAPVWARAQVALLRKDVPEMQRLMQENTHDLPVANHHDMAMALGHAEEAFEVAFDALERGEEAQAMNERMRNYLPQRANYVQWSLEQETIGSQTDDKGQTGDWQARTLHVQTRIALSDNLHLLLDASRSSLHSDNSLFAAPQPDADQLTAAQLQWLDEDSTSTFAVWDRSALQSRAGLSVEHTRRWLPRWDMQLGLDYAVPSKISMPLRLGGFENDVHAAVGYAFNPREYLRVSPRWSQYYAPSGDLWGSAGALDVEAGYRLRLAYPDWRVRVIASTRQFQDSAGVGTFYIPQSTSGISACVDMGSNLPLVPVGGAPYHPQWKPYMDACVSQNDLGSQSWASGLGVVGSVLGRDQMMIEWRNAEDASTSNAAVRSLTLRYRMYF